MHGIGSLYTSVGPLEDWICMHYDCVVNAGMHTYTCLIIYSVGTLLAVVTIIYQYAYKM